MSGVDDKKVKERGEKEGDIPWFTQETNKALDTELALLHIGTRRPLEGVKAQCAFSRGLRSPGKKVSSAGFCASKN